MYRLITIYLILFLTHCSTSHILEANSDGENKANDNIQKFDPDIQEKKISEDDKLNFKGTIRSQHDHLKLKDAPFTGCSVDAYPPEDSHQNGVSIPSYVIDLDLPPKQRWTALIRSKKAPLKHLVNYMQDLMISLLGPKIFHFINESLPQLATTLSEPYYEEIQGIAAAGELTVSQVTMYNIFYEIFTVCTSIITQDEQGHILHGRNLDFGLFLGWDRNNHTWLVAELLRPLVVHLDWKKNNISQFNSVSYTGFIGVITALKKDKFAFSLDERFTWNGGYVGLLEWIIFKDYNQKWVSFLVREVMEEAQSFDEAKKMLSEPRLLAPTYFILSGTLPGQGVIITRFRDTFNWLEMGTTKEGQASWFLVETNYDHWKSPPFYDDRRTPAVKCLMDGGQSNATFKLIYNVLSTKPVLNKLTTYTTLMDTKKGSILTWLRDCPDPCWPW